MANRRIITPIRVATTGRAAAMYSPTPREFSSLPSEGITPTEAPEVLWNFEKFLIGRDGKVARRFAPDTAPDDAKLVAAIDAELAKA